MSKFVARWADAELIAELEQGGAEELGANVLCVPFVVFVVAVLAPQFIPNLPSLTTCVAFIAKKV